MQRLMGIAVFAAAACIASADLYVSEIYSGLNGPDGTPDWFEVTWTGAGTLDTGTLWYDDDSFDPTSAANLTSIVLNSGQSAVFLVSGSVGDIATFESIWNSGAMIGLAAGSGLGQGGDAVSLFDGNSAGANLIASASYAANDGTLLQTYEYDSMGNVSLSQVGVNGAYASNAFFNDSVGVGPDFMIALIGSPGAVPAPAAGVLLGLGGLVATRRRR